MLKIYEHIQTMTKALTKIQNTRTVGALDDIKAKLISHKLH